MSIHPFHSHSPSRAPSSTMRADRHDVMGVEASSRFDSAASPEVSMGRSLPLLILLSSLVIAALLGCGRAPLGIADIEEIQSQGRFEESVEPLRELLKSHPGDTKVQYLYAVALTSTGRNGSALWALHAAMADPEYQLPAGKLFIRTLIMGDAFGDAIAVCNEMLDTVGEDPDILALRAWAKQGSRQDYEGAIADADRVLELEPDNTEVLIPRTVALLTLERVEEAGEALRQLDDLYKDETLGVKGSGKFCTAGAMFAWEKGEPDLALERFDRCLDDFPDNGLLLPRALSFFDQRRDFERALEILRTAIELQPNDLSLQQSLALRLESMGRRDDAIGVLQAAAESDSPSQRIQALALLAAFQAGTEDLDGALQTYEEALELSTTRSPDLDFRYADSLIQAGRFDEAVAFAENMTVPAQQSLIRGRAFLSTDRPAEALEALGAGNRLWPNNAIARYYTAVAAEQTADIDRAVEEYRYTIRIDPAATDAPLRLAQYNYAKGDPNRAIGILTSSIPSASGSGRVEMEMLLARILSLAGRWSTANPTYIQMVTTPDRRAATMVAVAEGVRDRANLATATRFLEDLSDVDWTQPRNAAALTRRVEWLIALDRSKDALRHAKAAVEAHPKVAGFQSAYALALDATGAEASAVEAAYGKGYELDPNDAFVTRVYLSFVEAANPSDDRIVELYAKLVELDNGDVDSAKKLAKLLQAEGDDDGAYEVLDDLVLRRPWDADALLSLAGLLLEMPPSSSSPERVSRARGLYARAQQLQHGVRNVEAQLDQVTKQLQAVPETEKS